MSAAGSRHRRRILLVSEPGVDGVFRHVEGLARFLLARGHEIDLAYSARRGGTDLHRLVREVERGGGATLDLGVDNRPGWRDVPALWRLQRLVVRRRPHIIHAHSSKAGALVRLLPRVGGASLIYSPHAYYGLRPGAHWQGRFYNRLEWVLGRRGTTLNVSDSEAGFARVVLAIPAARRATIANGVDRDLFRPPTPEERRAARAAFGLAPDQLALGAVARLCEQKDPRTLYRAVALARRQGCPVHLIHLGSGPECEYAPELRALQPHVTRRAEGSPIEVYRAVDGLMGCSRYEGLSLVLLEAMACGLPLVVSDVPGNDDVLRRHPSHALRFPPGDVDAAAAAIGRWAAWIAAGRPVTNHRAIVARHYDAHRTLRSIESAYAHAAQGALRPVAVSGRLLSHD